MKAVLVREPGDVEQLYIGEYTDPTPSENEILVHVKATAINRADIMQRKGHYPPPKGASPIMGLEMAGVVIETGSSVTKWKKGDRVFGLMEGGGYAEFATIHEDMAMPIPEELSFLEAAAIPEVFLTGYQCLFWIGNVRRGEKVLIHAGASGVGTASIQMAKAKGAKVAVTAGSDAKLEACRKLGADIAINYKTQSFADVIKNEWGPASVDVILDFIGASYWDQNMDILGMDGRLVLISTLGGYKLSDVDLRIIMGKRLTVTGTTLRSRNRDYKARLTHEFMDSALPLFKDSRLVPIIDKVFPIKEIQDAHRYIEANKNIGKVVLDLGEIR
ncbi:MAG: NAD(P)H-quinone oxidoreductase [Tuberibacillus sp.]